MTLSRTIFFSSVAVVALALGAFLALPGQRGVMPITVNGATVVAEVAKDPYSRAIGLSGRASLARSGGMFFIFEEPDYYSIWMKGMRFPLDIMWIKDGVVVDMEEYIPAPAEGTLDAVLPVYRPDVPADYVLEVNAGFAKENNISIGSQVKFSLTEIPGDAGQPAVNERGSEYFIENLRKRGPDAGGFKVEGLLAKTGAYQKYAFSYRSDNLKISGVMNVPAGREGQKYPVLILNHGLIPEDIYFSGRGSKREQDFLARNGYVTLHPDYRGLASSSPNPEAHHDFYVGYTRDVVNLVEALKKVAPQFMDLSRMGMWGHSMGGGIAARAMVLVPDVKAYVLFASISADAKDNFYELSPVEVAWLGQTYGTDATADEIYKKISPLTYFEDVTAAVQLHHGAVDGLVPIVFSEKMHARLKELGKKIEYYSYPGQEHEFIEGWPLAAERSLQFFDRYVKNSE